MVAGGIKSNRGWLVGWLGILIMADLFANLLASIAKIITNNTKSRPYNQVGPGANKLTN